MVPECVQYADINSTINKSSLSYLQNLLSGSEDVVLGWKRQCRPAHEHADKVPSNFYDLNQQGTEVSRKKAPQCPLVMRLVKSEGKMKSRKI